MTPRAVTPRRLSQDDDLTPVLALIHASFADMEGRIDPPSSALRLTVETLRDHIKTGEVWVIEDTTTPIACIILTPQTDALYLSKLAVHPDHQRTGLGQQLLALADQRCRARGKRRLTLKSRIQLTAAHRTFARAGFRQTGQTAHPGFDHPTSLTLQKEVSP